jgi:hypothetical protein
MEYAAFFFAGAFLCNCVPHVVCGLQGAPFPTPFAKPRGVGLSSPIANFAWGLLNLVAGMVLLQRWPIHIAPQAPFLVFLLGVAVMGAYSSTHFGRVRRDGKL